MTLRVEESEEEEERILIHHRAPNDIGAQGGGETRIKGSVAGLPPLSTVTITNMSIVSLHIKKYNNN